MAFSTKPWANDLTTPLSAAALIDLETRLSSYADLDQTFINVVDYGAVGNNSTNNATAFAAAATAANTSASALGNGAIVWVPPGIYRTSAPFPIRANTTLMGVGSSSIIRATGNNYCVALSPGYRVRISGLGFDAVSAQTSGGGIDFTSGGSKNWIDHVQCGDNLHTMFNVGLNAHSDYFFDHCTASSLTSSGLIGVSNVTYGFQMGGGGSQSNQMWIDHFSGTALPNSSNGVGTWVYARYADTFHISNSLFQCGQRGLVYAASSGYNSACKLTNVSVDGQNIDQISLEQVKNFVATNVQLTSLGVFAGAAEVGPAFYVKGTLNDGVTLADSNIHNTPRMAGVKIESSQGVNITGNTFSAVNTSGTANPIIYTSSGGVTDFTISDNQFLDCGGGSASPMISIPSGSNRYVVTNNRKDANSNGVIVSDSGGAVTKAVANNI